MKRREILQSMGLVATHVLFPSILSGFISSCQDPARAREGYAPAFFSREEFETIKEIVDTILPTTKSVSASEVNTHLFLDEVFHKCMNAEQQALIKEGLEKVVPAFSSAENKLEVLAEIDRKAYEGDEGTAYFKVVKQYALVGFFTSQEGMTVASNFVKFPGNYKGEIPCDENTLNYGKTDLRYYL